uniref:Alpha-macroglobulin receptor-binding domain-containing protein n=1 Tax=Anopheles farauti TaxID=69004 RepID=A0A182Q8P5_9DIPT
MAVDERYINNYFQLTLDRYYEKSDYTLILKVCTSFVPNLSAERSSKAMIEVNFPNGFAANKTSLLNLSDANPITNYELQYNRTTLLVYYASIGTEWTCFNMTANRLLKVAPQRKAYVLVHDILKPEYRAIVQYGVPPEAMN